MKSKRTVGGLVAALVVALLSWWVYGDDGVTQEPSSSEPAVSVPANGSGSIDTEITPPFANTTPTVPTSTTTVAMADTTAFESGLDPDSGLEWVAAGDLPTEAHDTLALINDDGPYPYDQDGATFENREGILPDHPIGYYREFTVDTPGESDRGARRIVVGDGGEFYYTDDHYESFERISR